MGAARLAEYRVVARNVAAQSENRIHDDTVARQYGFGGGLVPGVIVYAYATSPLVATLGAPWLARGTVTIRFVKPVLDGEEIRIAGSLVREASEDLGASLSVRSGGGQECAVATAMLPAAPASALDVRDHPETPLPADRPRASPESLVPGRVLGTIETLYEEGRAARFLDEVGDDHALYRGSEGLVHPAFFLDQANRALVANVHLGPWIHVASAVRHLGEARVGARYATRGRVAALWARRGRELVELDLLVVAEPETRPVAHVRHTAIWKLPRPEAS